MKALQSPPRIIGDLCAGSEFDNSSDDAKANFCAMEPVDNSDDQRFLSGFAVKKVSLFLDGRSMLSIIPGSWSRAPG